MSGRFNHGFTFLELMVVIMLMGIMATIIIPNLRYLMPGHKRQEFVTHVSKLVQLGWQNALVTQKAHRLFFDLNKRIIRLEIETKKPQPPQEFFELVSLPYAKAQYQWPDNIQIKQFIIEGNNLMGQQGFKADTVWFYMMPQGLVQDAVIVAIDTNERAVGNKPFTFSLTVNPFTAHVSMKETVA